MRFSQKNQLCTGFKREKGPKKGGMPENRPFWNFPDFSEIGRPLKFEGLFLVLMEKPGQKRPLLGPPGGPIVGLD